MSTDALIGLSLAAGVIVAMVGGGMAIEYFIRWSTRFQRMPGGHHLEQINPGYFVSRAGPIDLPAPVIEASPIENVDGEALWDVRGFATWDGKRRRWLINDYDAAAINIPSELTPVVVRDGRQIWDPLDKLGTRYKP